MNHSVCVTVSTMSMCHHVYVCAICMIRARVKVTVRVWLCIVTFLMRVNKKKGEESVSKQRWIYFKGTS